MRFNAIQNKKFTGEYWDYERVINTATQQIDMVYSFSKNLVFEIVTGEKGLMYLWCDEQLRYNSQIRNLRDASGKLVFKEAGTDNEKVPYVGISEPVFDVFGTVIGYRHDLAEGVE